MKPGILDFFVKDSPRDQQVKILKDIEASWSWAELYVVRSPVATGKTPVEVTVAKWAESKGLNTTLLVPTNILLNQLITEYPFIQSLHRKDSYHCDFFRQSCSDVFRICKKPCRGCVYNQAKSDVKKASIRAFNYHTYWAHKIYTPVLIIDEAHKMVELLQSTREVRLWWTKYRFPENLTMVLDVVAWAEKYQKEHGADEKLQDVIAQLTRFKKQAVVIYNKEIYRGNEELVLIIKDMTASDTPPYLWPPQKVKKIILLSATIGPKDIEELGLDKRRVCFIETDSPIPAYNRRVIYDPVANMAYRYQAQAIPLIADKINQLLRKHANERGLIHLPYSIVEKIRPLLTDPRLLWHTREDKSDVLRQFKQSTGPAVLIASGMYEGVDLPYDLARWQVIAKVPFLSLGDEVIKQRAERDPEWYRWEAIKRLLQTVGRTTRTQDDFSTSYILDVQFQRLWDEDKDKPANERMFPHFFRSSVVDANLKPL